MTITVLATGETVESKTTTGAIPATCEHCYCVGRLKQGAPFLACCICDREKSAPL